MVLINGVKYACERCIRGHRVTTCTHTDQPLTMIKPKGRPALQCHHCRDQRKLKNLHVSCTCGKKGKSPGMHLALCPCHKNTHCNCCTTGLSSTTGGSVATNGAAAPNGDVPTNIAVAAANGATATAPATVGGAGTPTVTKRNTKLDLTRRRLLLERSASDLSLPILDHKMSVYPLDEYPYASDHLLDGAMALAQGPSAANPGYNSGFGLGTKPTGSVGGASGASIAPQYVIEDVLVPFGPGLGLFELFLPSPEQPLTHDFQQQEPQRHSQQSQHPHQHPQPQHLPHQQVPQRLRLQLALHSSLMGVSRNSSSNGARMPQLSPLSPPTEEQLETSDNMFPLFPLVGTASFDTTNKPLSKAPSSNGPHYQPIRPKRPESVLLVTSNLPTATTNAAKGADPYGGILPSNLSAFPPVTYSQSSFDLNALNGKISATASVAYQSEVESTMNRDSDYSIGYDFDEHSDFFQQPHTQPQFTDLNSVFNDENDAKMTDYAAMLGKTDEKRVLRQLLQLFLLFPTSPPMARQPLLQQRQRQWLQLRPPQLLIQPQQQQQQQKLQQQQQPQKQQQVIQDQPGQQQQPPIQGELLQHPPPQAPLGDTPQTSEGFESYDYNVLPMLNDIPDLLRFYLPENDTFNL